VKDLTEIARIESGELRLSYEAVPVRKVIDEVRRSHQLLLEEKEQQLSIEINDDLQPILGDYNRQVQILTNLISNAHKYTPQGGLITVSASPIENTHSFNLPTADTFVHIAVQDSGIGIKPEDQTQIFQRFFRSSNKRALAIQGTGLGLNITKHLIELQNGRIWFESEYGKGTTFHYVLPVAG
ncbi:MAG: HAMP domain-containing sensor histidine kinase, partial [Chloroflexota bacterium]